MKTWKSVLQADPTEWLLEEDNPTVRSLTLTDILEKPVDDPEVRRAQEEIMATGLVPQILAGQQEGGYWDKPERHYHAKYKGTINLKTKPFYYHESNTGKVRQGTHCWTADRSLGSLFKLFSKDGKVLFSVAKKKSIDFPPQDLEHMFMGSWEPDLQ